MSILDAYDESTQQVAKVMDAAPLPEPVPEPKHSAWTVVPRALAGAALEVAGNLVDVGSMIGQVAEGETRDYGDFEPLNTRPEASRPHYEMAREMRPDPLTAGLAENVIFGVSKGLSKAAFAVTAGGVLPGAAAFGLSEGMTTSEDLAEQGVDAATRQKVGAVTGVVSGASVLLPVAGTSLLKTAGLVAAGGPAAYIAQEAIIKDILEEADYQKIADQHDPLDPVGLAVSTLLPAAFGAMAMRGAFKGKATQEQVDAAMVHNTTLKADQFEAETPQAVAAMKQAEESVKDIRATYEHTGDIGKTITERLMDLGVPAQEAADKGLLWDTFFKSMESTTGKEAGQLFGKYFDRVFNAGEDLPDDAVMHGDVLAQGVKLGYPEDYGFVPDQPAPDEVTNSANIAALRRTAAGLERPEDGVTLHVTDDGRAIATGPKGTRVPETFVRFAQENGLKFMAQRQLGSVRPIITHGNIGDHYGSAMPVDYRAAGALYFNEMGKAFVDRTGRALFQSQFDLKAQTPEELAARAKDEELAQKGDLAAQKRQADRATADALRNEFKLTGSDRPADVAAAHGQQALFQMADRAHAKAIETPEFKRWFGDSKVVDAEGKPLVVYHGTDKKFTKFSFKNSGQKIIWFTSDKGAIDAGEVGAAGKGITMDMYASIKNPAGWKEYDKFGLDELEARGYDGVILPEKDGTFSGFVFEGKQLKSASRNRGTFDPNDPNILKQSAPVFYSQLSKSIEDAPAKVFGTGKQLKEWITANAGKLGVKKDEIEATGLNDWLSLQGKVSKEQVQEFLKNNGVKVEEVTLGKDGAARRISELQRQYPDDVLRAASNGEQGQMTDSDYQAWQRATEQVKTTEPAKFEKYQLPGGENYRELLLTLPAKRYWNDGSEVTAEDISTPFGRENADRVAHYGDDVFNSSHFPDQPNILAHVRFNERTDADGKRVLFLEELQSDWAQKGRKEGFAGSRKVVGYRWDDGKMDWVQVPDDHAEQFGAEKVDAGHDALYDTRAEAEAKLSRVGVPTAPFVTDTKAWVALALKRMIRYAAENGFDRVAWTNGEQQAARYDLSKQVDSIRANRIGENEFDLIIQTKGSRDPILLGGKTLGEVEDNIGKDMARKIEAIPVGKREFYSGLDLKVGGEGMKGFYDQIVPQVANDVLKKLGGGKVGEITISDRAPKTLDTIMREEFGIGYGEATDQQLQHALAIKNTPNGSYAIASQKVIKRGDLEGGRPSVEFVPDERFGRFKTVMEAKAHYMREMDNALRNASDEYVAKHFDQQARNVGDIKVVKVDPVYGKGEDKRYPATQQRGFDITPALREKVMAGLPLFQKTGDGARGFLEFGQNGKMGIGLLASADKSTFLHESGHFFLEVMNDLSNEANAPPELRADMQAIHEWMGVSREQWASMSLEQKRPYHEQWARGFEQYLMEGKAPTSRLKEAFARFRDWLIEIYKSATALNVTLSDDVRKVMDNMLTVKESEPRQSSTGDGVPPPRASIGEDSAGNSDLDKALTSGEPLLDKIRPLDDPDLVATLQDMAANEAGWAEKGGNLMREFGDEGEVTGRTQWIPKAEWWPDRPGAGKANRKLNEAQVAEAVRKHLAGEPLKSLELQTVEYMSKIANDRLNSVEMIGDQEFGNTMQDIAAESIEPTTEKVFDSQAVARALDLNPEATMQAMERYDIHDDDAIIMAEIRSIIDEAGQQSLETAQGRAEDTGKEADPIQSEAERIVAEDPERRIPIGTGPDGEAVTLTAREYLDQARAQADQARQDVNLIKAAAECLLGQI